MTRRVGSCKGTRKLQIDVGAINEDAHTILVGECLWTVGLIRKCVVEEFYRRAENDLIGLADKWHVIYALYGRSGFTSEAH